MSTNRQVILAECPRYIVQTASCFRMDEGPMPTKPGANAPDAIQGVFEGRNRGTRPVEVAD